MKPFLFSIYAALLLAGCASFSSDGGFQTVSGLTQERIGQSPVNLRTAQEQENAQAQAKTLLAQELTADTAVQVALLRQPDLQADYAQLGIAEADWVRAGRLPNPALRLGRLSGDAGVEIDRAVLFDVLGLITMPMRRKMEQKHFEQVQMQAAMATIRTAAQARRAFFDAVAAQQLQGYFAQVQEAAALSHELADRMQKAGNFSALDQGREQSFYLDAQRQSAAAQHQVTLTQAQLRRALGVEGNTPLLLPQRLPDLPAQLLPLPQAAQQAIDQRLDVLLAKRETEALAQSLGLVQSTRLVNVLQAGYQNKSASGLADSQGYALELELPLFDFGSTKVARAEAVYRQSMEHTRAVALQAQAELAQSYSAYQTRYTVARQYRDEVLPLRQRMGQENMLRYNGMLISVFDLLKDAQEQTRDVARAVAALHDFWQAQTDLQSAMTAGSPASMATEGLGLANDGGAKNE